MEYSEHERHLEALGNIFPDRCPACQGLSQPGYSFCYFHQQEYEADKAELAKMESDELQEIAERGVQKFKSIYPAKQIIINHKP